MDVTTVWALLMATKLRRSRFSCGNVRISHAAAPRNAIIIRPTPRMLAVCDPNIPTTADAAVMVINDITANRAGRVIIHDASLFLFLFAIFLILCLHWIYFIITLTCFKMKTGRAAPGLILLCRSVADNCL